MVPMLAKRSASGYDIFEEGHNVPLGSLILPVDHRRPPVFKSEFDNELADCINTHFEYHSYQGIMDILTAVRGVYERLEDDRAQQQAAEIHAENAWLRAAETSPEAFEEMVWQDMAGFS